MTLGPTSPSTTRPKTLEVVKYATGGRGADIVLDNIGAPYVSRNLAVLAQESKLIVIGLQGGVSAELNLLSLLMKRGSVMATSFPDGLAPRRRAFCQEVAEVIWPLIESGRIKPIVDSVLPMSEVAEAHRRIEAGDNIGKVVLTIPRTATT